MVKNLLANAEDIRNAGSIWGLEDPLEEGGHGNPLQYSCLENPMERSLEGSGPRGRTDHEHWSVLHS